MNITAVQRRAINTIMYFTHVSVAGTDAVKIYGPGAETYFIATTYPHKAGYFALRPELTGSGYTQAHARDDLLDTVTEEVTTTL